MGSVITRSQVTFKCGAYDCANHMTVNGTNFQTAEAKLLDKQAEYGWEARRITPRMQAMLCPKCKDDYPI